MNKKNQTKKTHTRDQLEKIRPIFLVVALALTVISVMLYSFSIGRSMAVRYNPLIDATMEIKLEAAIAHLWFEEAISGDRSVPIEDIWRHLDQAEWYARAMLEGGENREGKFVPLKDPALRREIEQTLEEITVFRGIAKDRWKLQSESGIGSDIDQRFDQSFDDFLASAEDVETALQLAMERQLQKFRILRGLLVVLVVSLSIAVGIVLQRHEYRRINDMLALRSKEENLHTTLQSIGDAVIATDTDGAVVRMNPVAEKLTGWTFEDALGKPHNEVFRIVHAHTRDVAENPIDKVLGTGQIVGLANHTMLISKNGTEYQIADSGSPIRNDAGETIGVVLVFRDVTQEYRMQDTLRESEANLQSVFRSAPTGIGVVINRVFIQANEQMCEMVGFSREELIGQKSRMLYVDDAEYERVGREKYEQIRDHGTGTVETQFKWGAFGIRG